VSAAVKEDADLTPEERERANAFLEVVRELLKRHRITPLWRSQVAVVVTPGQAPRLVGRPTLVRELQQDDLQALAREVRNRKTRPNEVLVMCITDHLTRCWPLRLEGTPDAPFTYVPADPAIRELLA
jgi:hypothetical protein